MDLDDCPKDNLGLPVPKFPITTAKRAQWNLWLLSRIWSEKIPATEDDLQHWFNSVPVENPEAERFDSPREQPDRTHRKDGVVHHAPSESDVELWWHSL